MVYYFNNKAIVLKMVVGFEGLDVVAVSVKEVVRGRSR